MWREDVRKLWRGVSQCIWIRMIICHPVHLSIYEGPFNNLTWKRKISLPKCLQMIFWFSCRKFKDFPYLSIPMLHMLPLMAIHPTLHTFFSPLRPACGHTESASAPLNTAPQWRPKSGWRWLMGIYGELWGYMYNAWVGWIQHRSWWFMVDGNMGLARFDHQDPSRLRGFTTKNLQKGFKKDGIKRQRQGKSPSNIMRLHLRSIMHWNFGINKNQDSIIKHHELGSNWDMGAIYTLNLHYMMMSISIMAAWCQRYNNPSKLKIPLATKRNSVDPTQNQGFWVVFSQFWFQINEVVWRRGGMLLVRCKRWWWRWWHNQPNAPCIRIGSELPIQLGFASALLRTCNSIQKDKGAWLQSGNQVVTIPWLFKLRQLCKFSPEHMWLRDVWRLLKSLPIMEVFYVILPACIIWRCPWDFLRWDFTNHPSLTPGWTNGLGFPRCTCNLDVGHGLICVLGSQKKGCSGEWVLMTLSPALTEKLPSIHSWEHGEAKRAEVIQKVKSVRYIKIYTEYLRRIDPKGCILK